MNLESLAKIYFVAFQNKDLTSLRDLLHPDVTLRDWDVALDGRKAVLAQMSLIFGATSIIKVRPVKIIANNVSVFAELGIEVDLEKINVVDILDYSSIGKIEAIRAFKG